MSIKASPIKYEVVVTGTLNIQAAQELMDSVDDFAISTLPVFPQAAPITAALPITITFEDPALEPA